MAAESMETVMEVTEMEVEVEGGPSSAALPGGADPLQRGNFQWLIRRCDAVSDYNSSMSTSSGTLTLSTTYTSSREYSSSRSSHKVGEVGGSFNPRPVNIRELVLQFGRGDASAVERCLSELGADPGLRLIDTVKSILHAVEDYYASENGKGNETDCFEDSRLFFTRVLEAAILQKLHCIRPPITTEDIDVNGDPWGVLVLAKLRALLELTYPMEQARDVITILRSHLSLDPDTKSADEAVEMLKEAIFHIFEEIKTGIMSPKDDDHYWGTEILQGSPQVHIITRYITQCIIETYRFQLSEFLEKARKVGMNPSIDEPTLPRLTMDIVSCLQQKLAEKSQLFVDHSLGLLFLLNNTYYICNLLRYRQLSFLTSTQLPQKVEDHIQKYLQLSWEPVLSCLHDTTPPLCLSLGRSSPLVTFESKFNKVYNDQKLWKVPDPDLRTKLRRAIIEKVTSGLTKYLEDNNITTPSVTPQALEEMLQELFEG
ncbi:hypothetical protein ACP4OV_014032 [Aristida adscensionis]